MTDRNPTADDSTRQSRGTDADRTPGDHHRDPLFRSTYRDDESPSNAVVSAISTVTGVDPLELPHIYDSIDPDALDAIMESPVVVGHHDTVDVRFRYADHDVSVRTDGTITVRAPVE
jgi:hypothetical protein